MTQFPGEYFKLISVQAISRMDAALRPLGLTAAQSDILRFLSQRKEEATTVQDIGAFFHLRHPTVVGILRRLESKGFIVTETAAYDRRCRVVRLTEKADEVRRVMEPIRKELDEHSARGFSEEELVQLSGFLRRIYENVSTG